MHFSLYDDPAEFPPMTQFPIHDLVPPTAPRYGHILRGHLQSRVNECDPRSWQRAVMEEEADQFAMFFLAACRIDPTDVYHKFRLDDRADMLRNLWIAFNGWDGETGRAECVSATREFKEVAMAFQRRKAEERRQQAQEQAAGGTGTQGAGELGTIYVASRDKTF